MDASAAGLPRYGQVPLVARSELGTHCLFNLEVFGFIEDAVEICTLHSITGTGLAPVNP